jgi:hypothetical protein
MIMKRGILVALAALALAVVAVPDADAHGHAGPDLNQRVSGSSFTNDPDESTGHQTGWQNLIAKGQPGRAHIDTQFELGLFTPNLECPAEFPFGGDLISFDWVETFNDGSLLTGTATAGLVCADGLGGSTTVASGNVTGGTGRFEGASGTWEAEALVANNGLTGSVTADFD